MPIPQGTGTGGGLADCWISPSDRAGQIDNILDRIAKIEQVLSLLIGMDVTAAQLSDITQSAGVLTDLIAVASNSAGGWTTDGTFTGVAISTLGWLMADGNRYPIVTMQDGVLQYGFDLSGNVSGAQSGSSAPTSWLICKPASATITSQKPDISTVISSYGTAFGTSNLSTGRIDILEAGFYWASVNMLADVGVASSGGYKYMEVYATGSTGARDYGYRDTSGVVDDARKASFQLSFGMEIEAADLDSQFQVQFFGISTLMSSVYQYSNVSIMKLRNLP